MSKYDQPKHGTSQPNSQSPASDPPQETRRRALGRGLESLLPPRAPSVVAISASGSGDGEPLQIPIEQISRNPYQTRKSFDPEKLTDLAQSIAANGVIQPILVRPLPASNGVPAYQLIAGERRLIASKNAGKTTIPAIVKAVSDAQAMEFTIVENLQRADLNPMEQARAFQRLSQDFQMTQEQMAVRTGKDRATIANFVRLLRLPEPVQALLEQGEITPGHARALLALPDQEAMTAAAQKIVALALSVRHTETYVQGLLNPESREKKKAVIEPLDANVREARDSLQRSLGLRVKIEDKNGRGRVIIEYARLEDFDLIMEALDSHRGK